MLKIDEVENGIRNEESLTSARRGSHQQVLVLLLVPPYLDEYNYGIFRAAPTMTPRGPNEACSALVESLKLSSPALAL